MRAHRVWIFGGLVVLDLLVAVSCLVSVKYGGASREPWWILGIALMAFGAVGSIAVVVMRSLQLESDEAHPSDSESAADGASGSS